MIKVKVFTARKAHYVVYDSQYRIHYFCTSKKHLIETTFRLLEAYSHNDKRLIIYDVKDLSVDNSKSITDEDKICKVDCLNGRVVEEGKLFKQNLWLIDKITTIANELFKFSK